MHQRDGAAGGQAIAIAVALLFGATFVYTWNTLNSNYQGVKASRSHYGGALDLIPEKIKGVWEMCNQYLDHESGTYKAIAEARNGIVRGVDNFHKLPQSGSDSDAVKGGQDVYEAVRGFRTLAMTLENYPNLKGMDATSRNMRTLDEGVNEIKTALDDWINAIKVYNTHRGSFMPSMLGSMMTRFPAEIDYYTGHRESFNVDALNPQKHK
jgi:hypothetical protein